MLLAGFRRYPFPQVRLALWRDADALASGQWWRLVTPLLVQYDAVWQIVVVFAGIAGLGVLAERIFGHGWWLLLYLGCGVVGQAFGYLWEPRTRAPRWPGPVTRGAPGRAVGWVRRSLRPRAQGGIVLP